MNRAISQGQGDAVDLRAFTGDPSHASLLITGWSDQGLRASLSRAEFEEVQVVHLASKNARGLLSGIPSSSDEPDSPVSDEAGETLASPSPGDVPEVVERVS